MDLHFLKIWHRSFTQHVLFWLDGLLGADHLPEAAGSPRFCVLGKWLAEHCSDKPEFRELVEKHDEFHAYVSRCLDTGTDSVDSLAQSKSHLTTLSQEISRLIEQLEQQNSEDGIRLPSMWSDALLIGIPEIDTQHRGLAELIDHAMVRGEKLLSSELGADFLGNLTTLLVQHYATEELLLQRTDMPKERVQKHIEHHSVYLERVVDLSCSSEFKGSQIKDVLTPLRTSLIEHIFQDSLHLRASLKNSDVR